MAISTETKTLLSLDRFAAVAGIHPLHFNQVFVPDIAPGSTCDVPIMQFAYQVAGRTGREDIARAIATAENMIATQLGCLPAVDWTVEEPHTAARPFNPVLYSGGLDIRGQFNTIRTNRGYVWTGGQKGKTLVAASQAVVYTDTDGDGYFETATITVATTVTDVQELALYYPGKSGQDNWEIRPLQSVAIAAGVATIVCRREQLVQSALLFTYNPQGVDGLVDANFLDEVDVYRLYNDPSQQVQLIWDAVGGLCECAGEGCATCGYGVENGCLVVRDNRVGMVAAQPGTWNAVSGGYDSALWAECRAPDRLRLWYRSGWKNSELLWPYRQMDPMWERAIVNMTMGLLQRQICSCEPLENAFMYWREDLSHSEASGGKSSSWQLSRGLLNNPFGMWRGAISAWELVANNKIGNS